MTETEEHLYWIGFAKRAPSAFGVDQGGTALAALVRSAGKPIPANMFPRYGWREDNTGFLPADSVRVLVCRLRQAFDDMGLDIKITTEKGKGYSITPAHAAKIKAEVEASL